MLGWAKFEARRIRPQTAHKPWPLLQESNYGIHVWLYLMITSPKRIVCVSMCECVCVCVCVCASVYVCMCRERR